MKVYVLVSGHMEGSSDTAYLHGVFSTEEKAVQASHSVKDSVVKEVGLDQLQAGPGDDYYERSGIRII